MPPAPNYPRGQFELSIRTSRSRGLQTFQGPGSRVPRPLSVVCKYCGQQSMKRKRIAFTLKRVPRSLTHSSQSPESSSTCQPSTVERSYSLREGCCVFLLSIPRIDSYLSHFKTADVVFILPISVRRSCRCLHKTK